MVGKALVGLVALLWAGAASAAIVSEGDWALDTSTNLEWLRPSLSVNGGWLSSGWQLATISQLQALSNDVDGTPDPFVSTLALVPNVVSGQFVEAIGYLAGGDAGDIQATGPAVVSDGWNYGPVGEGVIATPPDGDLLLAREAPEASTLLMTLLGFAALGYAARSRRHDRVC